MKRSNHLICLKLIEWWLFEYRTNTCKRTRFHSYTQRKRENIVRVRERERWSKMSGFENKTKEPLITPNCHLPASVYWLRFQNTSKKKYVNPKKNSSFDREIFYICSSFEIYEMCFIFILTHSFFYYFRVMRVREDTICKCPTWLDGNCMFNM